jgi:hypothetical protein
VFRRHLPICVVLSAVLSGAAAWVVSEPVDETAAWRIVRVAVSRSGRWTAVGAASGWIGIIDRTQPDSPQRFRGGSGELHDLRFTNDERWLIVENDALARHAVQSLGSLEAPKIGRGYRGASSRGRVDWRAHKQCRERDGRHRGIWECSGLDRGSRWTLAKAAAPLQLSLRPFR